MSISSVGHLSAKSVVSDSHVAAGVVAQQLPEPAMDNLESCDLTSMLMSLEQKSVASQTQAAVAQIKASAAKAKEALDAQAEARRIAAEKAKDGGFWDDVKSVATTVGTIAVAGAAIAATGGVSTPAVLAIAGAAMSSSSTLLKATGNDGQLAGLLGTGGMICGLAAGGYGIGSAAMGTSSSLQSANAVSRGFSVVGSTARVAEGGSSIAAAQYHAAEMNSSADAKARGFEAKEAKNESQSASDDIVRITKDAQDTVGEILDLQIKIQASRMAMTRNIGVRG